MRTLEHKIKYNPPHPWDPKNMDPKQHLLDLVTTASLAIESVKDEEIERTGIDPIALSMLPELALYDR